MFTIEFSSQLTSLLQQTDLWDRLSRGVPFRESAWLGPWWQTFGDDRRAHVLIARDADGHIRGILPLYRTLTGPAGGRTLAMIGDGDACSDYVSVLADPADAIEVATAMGQHLCRTAADGDQAWDRLDIDGVVEGDQAMVAFADGLKSAGATLHAQSRMSVWVKPADACWEEHLKHHGKTQRRKMRRWRETIDQNDLLVRSRATTVAQVDEYLDAMISLHQRRWNEAGQPGSFADPRFHEFIFATAKQFFNRGRLYLVVLQHNGQVIAGDLNLIGQNRVMYSFSSGYDIDHANLEPGRLICIDALCELYRSELVALDFMRGDEEYKQRFATQSQRLFRLRAAAPNLMPRLRHAAWYTGFEVKQWMRRRTGRTPITVADLSTPMSASAVVSPQD